MNAAAARAEQLWAGRADELIALLEVEDGQPRAELRRLLGWTDDALCRVERDLQMDGRLWACTICMPTWRAMAPWPTVAPRPQPRARVLRHLRRTPATVREMAAAMAPFGEELRDSDTHRRYITDAVHQLRKAGLVASGRRLWLGTTMYQARGQCDE